MVYNLSNFLKLINLLIIYGHKNHLYNLPFYEAMRANNVEIIRWFKFTLKPPNSITLDKLRLAIWDTSFWTFLVKFGHNGP